MLFKLAIRNLGRNRRRTLITMFAIALGIALVDVTICLQHGAYQDVIRRGTSSLAGHVVVQAEGYEETGDPDTVILNAGDVANTLKALELDATVQQRTFIGGLLNSTSGSSAVAVVALEPGPSSEVQTMWDPMVDGEWIERDRDLVIGAALAETLNVEIGDKLVFMTQANNEMTSRLFRLKGVYRTGAIEQDGSLIIMTLAAAQMVTEKAGAATQVAVQLTDGAAWPAAVASAKEALAGQPIEVLSWKEALPEVDAFIVMDRRLGQGMVAVLFIIVTMGVFNTFFMSVLERMREFGVLQSIGMTPRQIAGLVLLEGIVLGAISIVVGTALGAAMVWPMVEYGLDFSKELGEGMTNAGVVVSTKIYSVYNWPRMIVFAVGGFFVTIGAAVWPAWKVSRITPVQALRKQG